MSVSPAAEQVQLVLKTVAVLCRWVLTSASMEAPPIQVGGYYLPSLPKDSSSNMLCPLGLVWL